MLYNEIKGILKDNHFSIVFLYSLFPEEDCSSVVTAKLSAMLNKSRKTNDEA